MKIIDGKKYYSELDVIKITSIQQDKHYSYLERKEKHDFIVKIGLIITAILLLVLLIIWFGGYYLFPPIKNVINSSNIESSFNN